MSLTPTVETPSGKGAKDENFPVGSFLLPKHLRPHIAKYYVFARAIDDIADNCDLAPETKVARLNDMDNAVCGGSNLGQTGFETASLMHQSLQETKITTKHCSDLIDAFRQDAVKNRYDNWDELINYCMRSAAPVGRYLLDLHGEDRSHYPYSDALCNALQVINHLQDCKDDYLEMDRVYLPQVWLKNSGSVTEDLNKNDASSGLRSVMDQCLKGTKRLLLTADKLPGKLKSRRLAMESKVILNIAHKLVNELEKRDPLSERIELTKPQLALCTITGILGGLVGS